MIFKEDRNKTLQSVSTYICFGRHLVSRQNKFTGSFKKDLNLPVDCVWKQLTLLLHMRISSPGKTFLTRFVT